MRKYFKTCILSASGVIHSSKWVFLVVAIVLAGCSQENPFVTLSDPIMLDLDVGGKIIWTRYQSALENEDIDELNDIFNTPLECVNYQYLILDEGNESRAVVVYVANHCLENIVLPAMSIGIVGRRVFLSQDLLRSKMIYVVKPGEAWSKRFLFNSKESELSLIYNRQTLTRLDPSGFEFKSDRVPISKREPLRKPLGKPLKPLSESLGAESLGSGLD